MAKIRNLPPKGGLVVFRVIGSTRDDLQRLRKLFARCSGQEEPLRISEVLRMCVSFTMQHEHDLICLGDKVMAQQARKK